MSDGPEVVPVAGAPTAVIPIRADREVAHAALPAGRVARLVHAGGFDRLAASWQRLSGWVQEQGLTPGGVFWEVYLTQPSPDGDPAQLRTELDLLLSD